MFILCLLKEMSFVDQVRVELSSGGGGQGAVHFQSSRKSPRRGPDGGDGGRGGDVILTPDPRLKDLSHLKPNTLYKAGDGKPGGEAKKKGAGGKASLFPSPLTLCAMIFRAVFLKKLQIRAFWSSPGDRAGGEMCFLKPPAFRPP